ncbi:glycosyltransferase family 2 protein [Kocuria sp. p3-SID1433]|uniref:glycosyltransferase family 2 protein n=1 Tax=unclassified Kocuria TaxID=2649579 RepID=UPI0021A415AA|nr:MULTISPECIES: glycosyltransferase family A protein [unclassified Kocuria]MCT1602137.1 glycosyltransferase family 2 protein [Kocuria sp. p3-SID1428]MCT2179608.1 glycosyltransferase family 2 protein [Kocuria sp. p3-SID1433]
MSTTEDSGRHLTAVPDQTQDAALVSVIIAAYGAERFLGEALSSLMRQTWPNLEIIVIDDGSRDRTAQLARVYAEMEVPGRRVVVESQANSGVAAARNRGIGMASGEIITFLDADDAFLPGAISRLMAERERLGGGRVLVGPQGADVTGGALDTRRPMQREPMPAPGQQRQVILQYNIGCLASLFPREFFAEVGMFDESQGHAEDWELWLRAVYSGWRFHRLEEVLWLVWWSPGSLTSEVEHMGRGEDRALQLLLQQFREEMTPAEVDFVEHRLESGSPQRLIRQSNEALRAGRLEEAKQKLLLSAELMPAQKRVAVKARIARLPGGMQLLRRRQDQTDSMVDYDPAMGR